MTLWIVIAVLAFFCLSAAMVLLSRLAIRRVMKEQEKLRMQELQHQQELLAGSVAVQERERKRIAADLHDELSARLNVLKLQLYSLNMPEQAQAMLDETIQISRNISHELYPPLLAEFGLADTLQDYFHPMQQHIDIRFTYLQPQKEERLNAVQELQLFRISQELLNNVLKHAQATHVDVLLRVNSHSASLCICDNGKGFDPAGGSGLGMQNIKLRVQLLGGYYKFRHRKGTSFILYLKRTTDAGN